MKNTPDEPLTLTEALTSQSSCINVQNVESDIYRFYHMDVPFQVTLEYCNGSEPEDYVNVVTLSADKSVLYQESSAMKNYTRTKDVLHFHDYFEFVIVLEGSIVRKLKGRTMCILPEPAASSTGACATLSTIWNNRKCFLSACHRNLSLNCSTLQKPLPFRMKRRYAVVAFISSSPLI